MPSTPRLLDLIKNSPLSQDLTERDCGFLEEAMCTRTLEKDETLLREGEIDHMLHLVVAGRLAVTKDAAPRAWPLRGSRV